MFGPDQPRSATRWEMKFLALCFAIVISLCLPSRSQAQNTGRVECARDDGYVYLYSSVTTLDVRATLQCGELVQIMGRFDNYLSVRNAKGDTGYVPLASVVLLKDQLGTGLSPPAPAGPARERIHYDDRSRDAAASTASSVPAFTLLKNTPIRVKLSKTISSATAHVGDAVEFEVLEDILVEGVPVLTKGTKVSGVIAQAEPKKRFGHSGRIAFNITSTHLADGETAAVRCYQEATGASSTSAADAVVPLSSGKDVAIPQDTEFTATVENDMRLKRESFTTPRDAAASAPATSAQTPQPQH